jgi:hypothetical protein
VIFIALGLILGLFLVGDPIERDMAILIAMVALCADMLNYRLSKGPKTYA